MTKNKKILITSGGTGGHIYPAMGVAAQLLQDDPSLQILFAAGGLAESPYFDRKAYTWQSLPAAPLSLKSPANLHKNCMEIGKGTWSASKLLFDFSPDLVIGFGSYHTFPVLLAAYLHRVPIVLHEQNSKPGRVIRLFARRALFTGIYFPSAAPSLKGSSVLLKMPLRDQFSKENTSRNAAIDYFKLDPRKKTVLVFGGSQGAQFLNEKMSALLIQLAAKNEIQLLHFTGNAQQAERLSTFYQKSGIQAVVKPLEARMDLAWSVADLAIVRAGAGTIAEQMEFETPAIFIPYPYSSEGHQESNADFVVSTVGGGWKFSEANWSDSPFLAQLQLLLGEKDSILLNEKKQNLMHYKMKGSQEEFAWTIKKTLSRL